MAERAFYEDVMAAGFGATLEEHGFAPLRRTKAHYVRQGDGVLWRVVLRPASKLQPNSFRDYTTLYMDGLDAVCEEYLGFPFSNPIPGTKYRNHATFRVQQEWQLNEEERQKALAPRSKTWLERLTSRFRVPEYVPTRYRPDDAPFITVPMEDGECNFWPSRDDTPEKVAEVLSRLWRDLMPRHIDPFMSKDALMARLLDPPEEPDGLLLRLDHPMGGRSYRLDKVMPKLMDGRLVEVIAFARTEIQEYDEAIARTDLQIKRLSEGKPPIEGAASSLAACEIAKNGHTKALEFLKQLVVKLEAEIAGTIK